MAKKLDRKKFHAFVCYTEEDQKFVDKMADTLESKPYQLTCVRPDRDFLPGLSLTSNIDQHMEVSGKILFILSESSASSPWCRSQIQGILRDRKKDVAMVLLGDVTVPDYLQHLYRIQATWSMSGVWMTNLTRFLGYIACFTCQRNGRDTKAIVYCNSCHHGFCTPCQQQHRRQPDTHQHKTVDVTAVDVSPLTIHSECPDHHKPLELFCTTCKLTLCYICSVVSHRKCSVSTLTDSVSELKQSLSNIKDTLSQNMETALRDRNTIGEMEKKVSDSRQEQENKVKQEFSDMRTVLDKREKESLQQIQTISNINITKIHEKIDVVETEIRSLREKCDEISTALRSPSENTVYETYKEYKNENTEYKLSALTDLTLSEINIDSDFDKFHCDLNVREVKSSEMVDENKKTGPPVLYNTLTLDDVGFIFDMCVVTSSDSDFVIMTSHNKTVYCYDLDTNTLVSSLSVESKPVGVTSLSDSRVAVCLPLSKELLLMDIYPHLSLHSTYKTGKMYFGLTTLSPSTLVACGLPQSLDILDLTGRVLRSVCTDQQLTTLFDFPRSVCITRTGNILVTDFYRTSVTCVSDTGEMVFIYQPTEDRKLNSPTRVTANRNGDVLVRDNGKLVQLTSTGLFVRDVVRVGDDGISLIHSMYFDSQSNMYVVLSNDKDETAVKTHRFT